MEEEKGGVLHIIIIFVGIACLCLGLFMYFTDEKIELKEENKNYNNKSNTENNNQEKDDDDDKVEGQDLISQISLMNNVETSITTNSNKEIKIGYYISNETHEGNFIYNGKSSFKTNELEICDLFYLYNDSIIVHCTSGSATSGHLYIVDSNGQYKLINDFKYNENRSFIPQSISLKDGVIVINGIGVLEGSIVKINNKEIFICNNEEVKENNISLDFPAYADFELLINNGKVEFNYLKTTSTLEEFRKESCKNVE